MANTLRFKRGLVSGIPTAALGEPLFTTDTFDLYIGNGTTNTRFQKYIASGTTSQLLRGDGSLLTMPIVLTSPSNGQVLKYDGTNWVNSADAGVTGSGTTNYLPKFTGASTLGNSLVFDNGTNVGIGTTSPVVALDVRGEVAIAYNATYGLRFYNDARNNWSSIGNTITGSTDSNLVFKTATGVMTYTGQGRLLLGSTSDNGLRFQVTGDGYFSGSVGIGSTSISNVNLRLSKTITGSATSHAVFQEGVVQTDVTTTAYGFRNIINTANSLTLGEYIHFYVQQGTIGTSNAITNQYGYSVGSNLTSATNNFGFYGNIASGTGRWNLYMNGTAANYLAGNLGIGITTPAGNLDVYNATSSSIYNRVGAAGANWVTTSTQSQIGTYTNHPLQIKTNDTSRIYITNGGNVLIGTTIDATYKLDVNGTMRVSGASTVASLSTSSGTIAAKASGTESSSYQLSAITMGYDATNSIGWITAGGAAARTNLVLQAGGGNILIGTNTDTGGGQRLQVNGSSIFTSSVTSSSFVSASLQANTSDYNYLVFNNLASGYGDWNIYKTGANNLALGYGTDGGATYTNAVTFAYGGAATFSSSVTAGGLVYINGAATALRTNNTVSYTSLESRLNGTRSWQIDNVSNGMQLYMEGAAAYVFNIASTGAATFSSSIQAGTAIAIGTTPDTNKPFKVLKNINGTVGINFENTSTGASAFSAIQMGTDVSGGTKFTNLVYSSSGVTASGVYNPDGTSLINNGSGGLNFLGNPIRMYTGGSNGTLRWDMTNDGFITQYTGTNPSTNATDGYRQYSADVTAGNAAPHFRTENGAIIKLYQETTGVGNAIFSQGGGNSVLDDSTFDGYTLRQIVKALRNQGILQ